MHELAIAQSLVAQGERIAHSNGAARVERVVVRIGALCGVEPVLLERAFVFARAGSAMADALLEVEPGPIEVVCRSCGASSPAMANRIVCGACGDWRVDVVTGEEMLLLRLELSGLGEDTLEPDVTGAALADL